MSNRKLNFIIIYRTTILLALLLGLNSGCLAQEPVGSGVRLSEEKIEPPQSVRRFRQLDIFELEFASDPQISPNGERVVYVRNSFDIMTDKSQTRLWVVNADGKEHRPITNFDQLGSSPRWSPDGNRIAFVSSDGSKGQIFCRWMDTGETAKLTSLLESPSGLKWSPDGKKIAFSSFVPKKLSIDVKLPSKPQGGVMGRTCEIHRATQIPCRWAWIFTRRTFTFVCRRCFWRNRETGYKWRLQSLI